MVERDELSVRRAEHHELDARLREDLIEGLRVPTLTSLQRRVDSALRARTAARNVVALLERRLVGGDEVAGQRLPAAVDRAAAAGDRLVAALDRRSAAEILLRSTRDQLSGVLHRAAGYQQLAQELERARREQIPLVVVFVDVDGLKRVNDEHGHLAGDDVIRAVGSALCSHVRGYDVLFRFGGDEFVVGLSGVEQEEAELRLRRVAEAVCGLSPGMTFSVGFAVSQPDDAVIDVLGRADDDLYVRRSAARAARPEVLDLTNAGHERG